MSVLPVVGRYPPGTPWGGRFKPGAHNPQAPAEVFNLDDYRQAEPATPTTGTDFDPTRGLATWVEVADKAHKHAAVAARRNPILQGRQDDISQMTLEWMIKQQRAGKLEYVTPGLIKQATAWAVRDLLAEASLCSESEEQASRALFSRVMSREAELKRTLTGPEKRELAATVAREIQDSTGHKIRVEAIMQSNTTDSLDRLVGEDGTELHNLIAAEPTGGAPQETSALASQAITEAAMSGKEHKTRARALGWDAIAQTRGDGTPQACPGTLSGSRSASYRKQVTQAGGVIAVCHGWQQDINPGSLDRALFAPFGSNLSFLDQERVVETLLSYPSYADDLWNSAVQAASERTLYPGS